jgi:hypothetical protein
MSPRDESSRTEPLAENSVARFVSLTLCVSLLLCLLSCYQGTAGPSHAKTGEPAPPDLTHCTRVEIQYLPSLLDELFMGYRPADLLDPNELAHMQSLNPIIVEQRTRIEALARKISLGTYRKESGYPAMRDFAKVAGYCKGEQVESFAIMDGPYVRTKDGTLFHYHGVNLNLLDITTDLGPLLLRIGCVRHLRRTACLWYSYPGQTPVRPTPDTWCDAALAKQLRDLEEAKLMLPKEQTSPEMKQWYQELERREREMAEQYLVYIRNTFRCPAAGEGKCHYAMNSNCTAKSPPDTVFLFEAKAGWNQHGGPELFTFDHHNPRGGLVCLNDFTVKFIRTEEELKQLRWK